MSNVTKSNSWSREEVHKKISSHIEVNFDVTYKGHPNLLKTFYENYKFLMTIASDVKIYAIMCEPHCVVLLL